MQGLLWWLKMVLRQMYMGLGWWNSCGGQLSILGHWGGDRRQKRSTIWTVEGLLVWVK